MSILVLGTVALDTIKTPAGTRKRILGGSASHFAMSARLFTQVHLAANIGDDFPAKYVTFLKRKGTNLISLIRAKGKTFHWSGEYVGDLNAAITRCTELGVLSVFDPQIAKFQRDIKYMFLANVDPDIQGRSIAMMKRPKFIGLDSMNFWIEHKRKELLKLLTRVDMYMANDAEARALSGENNLVKAAKRLRSFGPKMIVIKKGEHGVLFYCDRFLFSFPGFPVARVIDPTGAGDTFAGGLMGYLARAGTMNEAILRKAIAYATVMASFNVEAFGVDRTARLTMSQVERRLKMFKRYIHF